LHMENKPSNIQEPPAPIPNTPNAMEPAKPQTLQETLKSATVDSKMFPYFGLWYFGNCYFIITSKLALNAAYGAAGFPVAIATLQLGFGCLYAFFLWATSGSKTVPNITGEDVFKMLPVAFYAALAHSLFVYSIGAGAVSLSLLVRAAEPVFADFLAAATDKKKMSNAKILSLLPIIGGIYFACNQQSDFAWTAVIAACMSNFFSVYKDYNQNKLVAEADTTEHRKSVGNQFELTMLLSFFLSIPMMISAEGVYWDAFGVLLNSDPIILLNIIASGLWLYGSNLVANRYIKDPPPVVNSLLHAGRYAFVMVGGALALAESIGPAQLVTYAVGLGGVFLYSLMDTLFPPGPDREEELKEWRKDKKESRIRSGLSALFHFRRSSKAQQRSPRSSSVRVVRSWNRPLSMLRFPKAGGGEEVKGAAPVRAEGAVAPKSDAEKEGQVKPLKPFGPEHDYLRLVVVDRSERKGRATGREEKRKGLEAFRRYHEQRRRRTQETNRRDPSIMLLAVWRASKSLLRLGGKKEGSGSKRKRFMELLSSTSSMWRLPHAYRERRSEQSTYKGRRFRDLASKLVRADSDKEAKPEAAALSHSSLPRSARSSRSLCRMLSRSRSLRPSIMRIKQLLSRSAPRSSPAAAPETLEVPVRRTRRYRDTMAPALLGRSLTARMAMKASRRRETGMAREEDRAGTTPSLGRRRSTQRRYRDIVKMEGTASAASTTMKMAMKARMRRGSGMETSAAQEEAIAPIFTSTVPSFPPPLSGSDGEQRRMRRQRDLVGQRGTGTAGGRRMAGYKTLREKAMERRVQEAAPAPSFSSEDYLSFLNAYAEAPKNTAAPRAPRRKVVGGGGGGAIPQMRRHVPRRDLVTRNARRRVL